MYLWFLAGFQSKEMVSVVFFSLGGLGACKLSTRVRIGTNSGTLPRDVAPRFPPEAAEPRNTWGWCQTRQIIILIPTVYNYYNDNYFQVTFSKQDVFVWDKGGLGIGSRGSDAE